ncbi:hypothetical protein DSO57_1002578 [Entomophthora muscae]|uniref:Uncharacterized protein n=1 Tax=Entomophthora muscae TaxID=34485 RepID=A0ACC2U794_9FUNG|nr:hypothetical protein DSO57_1002578 [Entomophthora muscae]
MTTKDWHNYSTDNSHQKESLAHGWFKYPSGHWGRKFHYGCASPSPPPVKPLLVRPNTSFYLLIYLVGYYLLGRFSSMMGRFAYLSHFGHLAMVTVPIGALAHQIGNLFPLKWVPDTLLRQSFLCACQPVNQMSKPIDDSPYLTYNYSKLGFAYVILLGFTEQVIPHMSAWQPWASAVSYILRIAPVVYWVCQSCPLSLFADEPDTTPSHDNQAQKISGGLNQLCEFTEAFAGQRLHLVV